MGDLLRWAKYYLKQGINCIPAKNFDGNKQALVPYEKWYTQRQDPVDLEQMITSKSSKPAWGFADQLMGLSGVNSIRVLDFDKFDDPDKTMVPTLKTALVALGLPANYPWVVISGSGRGAHIWLRCENLRATSLFREVTTTYGFGGNGYKELEVKWQATPCHLPPSVYQRKDGSMSDYRFWFDAPTSEPVAVAHDQIESCVRAVCILPKRADVVVEGDYPQFTAQDIDAALTHIPAVRVHDANEYDRFCAVAASVLAHCGGDVESAYSHLTRWSAPTSDGFYTKSKIWQKLEKGNFKSISTGSLVFMARENGYKLPKHLWKPEHQAKFDAQKRPESPPHPSGNGGRGKFKTTRKTGNLQESEAQPSNVSQPSPETPEATQTKAGFRPQPGVITPEDGSEPFTVWFENNHIGNAERLKALYGHNLRFVRDRTGDKGQWYHWTGKVWRPVGKIKFETLALNVLGSLEAEIAHYEALKLAERAENTSKWYNHIKYKNSVFDMLKYLRSDEVYHYEGEWEDRRHLLNLKNGVFDLERGSFTENVDPSHNFRLLMGDVTYDPAAECPNWMEGLMTWMGFVMTDAEAEALGEDAVNAKNKEAAELMAFVQEAVGYTLSGFNHTRKFFYLRGKGGNGKSVFMQTISKLLGDYWVNVPDSAFRESHGDTIPNDVAKMQHRRMVTTADMKNNVKLDESFLKTWTGGDAFDARFMREEFFTMKPMAKIWLMGNDVPELPGWDPAMRDRIIDIPFTVQIPQEKRKPIEELTGTYETELSGILNWAIEGWQRFLARNKRFDVPEVVQTSSMAFIDANNPQALFVYDCCEVDPEAEVLGSKLYKVFKDWCEENGYKRPFGIKRFYQHMEGRYNLKRDERSGRRMYLKGIRLIPEYDFVDNAEKDQLGFGR